MWTTSNIVEDLHSIGLKRGCIVNVKASVKSIGKMENGANTLIDALIEVVGPEGLIVTDSFIKAYAKRSAGYRTNISTQQSPSYAGALANAMISHPASFRSYHPIQKFCMIGRDAECLARNHTKDSYAYDILRIMAEKGGLNLKIGTDEKVPGVGTTHVAIGMAGIEQYRSVAWVQYLDDCDQIDNFKMNWAGACKEAIFQLNDEYESCDGAICAHAKVGNAPAKLSDMRKTLELELELIKKDPMSFLKCGSSNCITCELTWVGDRKSPFVMALKFLSKGDLKNVFRSLRVYSFKKEGTVS